VRLRHGAPWLVLGAVVLGLVGWPGSRPDPATPPGASPGNAPTSGDPPRGATPFPPPAPPSPPGPAVAALRSRVARLLSSTTLRRGEWSILAVSLDRGDTLLSVSPRRPLIPASNMKLFTTAAALHHLGPDFRYETFLLGTGPVREGRLEGDLVLYGTGDPSLSDRFYPDASAPFRAMVRELKGRGVREIEGDVVGDGSFLPPPLLHPGWNPRDLNDWFAAPVSGLSFDENLVTLRIGPGTRVGAPPRVDFLPPGAGLSVENRARTVAGRPRPRLWVDRERPDRPVLVAGEIRTGSRDLWRRMPVDDPAFYAARMLRRVLEEEGISVRGEVRSIREPAESPVEGDPRGGAPPGPGSGLVLLATHLSPPLLELLRVVNRESNNFYAESVLKTLGRVASGDGTFQGGVAVVRRFLREEVGLPPGWVRQVDGSGLSPENRAAAAAFVALLGYLAEGPLWRPFRSTLPEAGVRRSGLGRMGGTPAARNLRAKTGTMDGASALSGTVRSRTGERIVFSILSNGIRSTASAKRAEDRIGVALASLSRPAPGGVALSPEAGDTSPGREGERPARHRVQWGETFTTIARRYGVSLQDLLEANPDVRPERLRAGQVLLLPPFRSR